MKNRPPTGKHPGGFVGRPLPDEPAICVSTALDPRLVIRLPPLDPTTGITRIGPDCTCATVCIHERSVYQSPIVVVSDERAAGETDEP